MATLNLWNNFTKRRNSTKQPAGAADLSLDVKLKENCSIANPVFIVSGDYFTANYAQYAGMYYFVDDVVSVHNGLCEIHCSKDVLATYKSQIQASSPYVLYYTHNNTEIVDRRLSVKTSKTEVGKSGSFSYFGKGQVYVLSVVGKDCVSQIEVSLSDIKGIISQSFFNALDSAIDAVPLPATDSLVDFGQYILDLLKSEAGAFTYTGAIAECIKNCYVLPITSGAWGGTLTDICLGKRATGKQGYALNQRILNDVCTVDIPWQANDWRRNAPYHELFLYLPAIGLINISPSDVIDATGLNIVLTLDKISGDAIFEVSTIGGGNVVLGYYNANFAVNMPIGASNLDVTKAVTAIGGGLAASAAGLPAIGAAAVEALGITNALQPQAACIGGNSGGAFLGLAGASNAYCISIFHDTTVAPSSVSAIKGTPYNGVLSLSGISGYVQTAGASVDMPGFGGDRDTVNSLLDGGIYIE